MLLGRVAPSPVLRHPSHFAASAEHNFSIHRRRAGETQYEADGRSVGRPSPLLYLEVEKSQLGVGRDPRLPSLVSKLPQDRSEFLPPNPHDASPPPPCIALCASRVAAARDWRKMRRCSNNFKSKRRRRRDSSLIRQDGERQRTCLPT